MKRAIFLIAAIFALAGCEEEEATVETSVRGLKTHLVAKTESASIRRFPAVLEPSEIATLSFEVGGKLQDISLDVGQSVKAGDILAALDPSSLQLQVDTARAALAQAQSSAGNAQANFERQTELLERGVTTKVAVDEARTNAETAEASLTQVRKSLETAEQNLGKSELIAPFEGIVNAVEVESYATVAIGAPIASIYPSDNFKIAFSVNFDTVSRLVVGKPATIRLADRPNITLDAVVSEIGSRADAVSSFPIILQVNDSHPLLKAGMAVEAAIEFPLPAAEGFSIPLSAAIKDGEIGQVASPETLAKMGVFVFDPASSTVKRREVTVGGIRENALIVIDGLDEGDLIASAGVSFLREGQDVKLLDMGE
jgi:RND family efflux transporter MFP subunit